MKVNNSKITSLIKDFVGKQKYLIPDDVETYKDSTDLTYNIKDDLVNSARDSMKDVLDDLIITVHIMDWEDIIEVSIYGNTDDWGAFSIDKGEFNEDELNAFLDKYIGDEALLDNAKNNDTWEESLEEEPKLDTFDGQMDFLAKDEQEAIDGYETILALVDDENVKEQLNKIMIEEKAHKDFLEKVKGDRSLKYTEPLEDSEENDDLDEEYIKNLYNKWI